MNQEPDSIRPPPELEIFRPDDWHLHLRDGRTMQAVVNHTARQFGRALIMPNLQPPITTVDQAMRYRIRILAALPASSAFEPLMALYLTDRTSVDEVRHAAENPHVLAFKLYPRGATTNADSGVTALRNVYPVLEAMERYQVPLCIHGEVTDPKVDVFDREAVFIERELAPMLERFAGLRVVLEHLTTRVGVDYVQEQSPRLAATITPQHLLLNRNALFAGGLRPHHYCLPVLKRETDRQALIAAATSGSPKFFLGTDSAPHPRSRKENACGCAGCFSAPAALELYCEAFEAAGALERLEGFASLHGAAFYDLPHNSARFRLQRIPWTVPAAYPVAGDELVPLHAGERLHWSIHQPQVP